jgi:hypothetical protein
MGDKLNQGTWWNLWLFLSLQKSTDSDRVKGPLKAFYVICWWIHWKKELKGHSKHDIVLDLSTRLLFNNNKLLVHKKMTTFTQQIKPLSDKQIKLLKFNF